MRKIFFVVLLLLLSMPTRAAYLLVPMDQTQTNLFTAGVPAFLQIRGYKSQYDAPGSRVWPLDVYPALNDEVLS